MSVAVATMRPGSGVKSTVISIRAPRGRTPVAGIVHALTLSGVKNAAFVNVVVTVAKVVPIVTFIAIAAVGFKAGLALYLAATQLPKLFGFHGEHGDFWTIAGYFLRHLDETHPTAIALGGAALFTMALGMGVPLIVVGIS